MVSKNSKLLMFSKICDWIDSPWKLNFKNRRLQNNYLKNLSSHIIEDGRDERILHKWNELYNIISEIIENEALVKMNQDHILLDNILKAFNIQASIDYDIELLELLEEYLLFQVKYGEKEIFIISFFSNYLSNDDMIELASFSKREEIYIILIEHYLAPRFSKLPGRYIIIDEDLCEIIITET